MKLQLHQKHKCGLKDIPLALKEFSFNLKRRGSYRYRQLFIDRLEQGRTKAAVRLTHNKNVLRSGVLEAVSQEYKSLNPTAQKTLLELCKCDARLASVCIEDRLSLRSEALAEDFIKHGIIPPKVLREFISYSVKKNDIFLLANLSEHYSFGPTWIYAGTLVEAINLKNPEMQRFAVEHGGLELLPQDFKQTNQAARSHSDNHGYTLSDIYCRTKDSFLADIIPNAVSDVTLSVLERYEFNDQQLGRGLIRAVESNQPAIVERLIKLGANTTDAFGAAFYLAISRGRTELISIFLAHGAAVNPGWDRMFASDKVLLYSEIIQSLRKEDYEEEADSSNSRLT